MPDTFRVDCEFEHWVLQALADKQQACDHESSVVYMKHVWVVLLIIFVARGKEASKQAREAGGSEAGGKQAREAGGKQARMQAARHMSL